MSKWASIYIVCMNLLALNAEFILFIQVYAKLLTFKIKQTQQRKKKTKVINSTISSFRILQEKQSIKLLFDCTFD